MHSYNSCIFFGVQLPKLPSKAHPAFHHFKLCVGEPENQHRLPHVALHHLLVLLFILLLVQNSRIMQGQRIVASIYCIGR